MEINKNKIWFLQIARVVACLLVVYTHWYGLLTNTNELVRFLFPNSQPHFPTASITEYLGIFTTALGLNFFSSVHFGLGLFFILSGYVIPLSLKKTNPLSYLIRRLFRIYPTAIVCMILAAVAMLLAGCCLGSAPFNFLKFKVVISNLLLIRDLINVQFIEYSTWTLEIEMHFYIIFFLFFYYKKEKNPLSFIILTALLVVIYKLTCTTPPPHGWVLRVQRFVSINSAYLSFMFIGTTIYYTLSKQWTYITGLLTAAVLLILNYISLHTGPQFDASGSRIFINHLYVLPFFLILYASNSRLPFSKTLNRIANFSYPLYLTHGFVGYSLYLICLVFTQSILFSAIFAFSLVLWLATLIHRKVENRGIEYSKELLQKIEGRGDKEVVFA
ncbi:acyltransferase family protein [Legionella genomosp. 1]|uniref:acyltransferase family protein n=1 Tax=Legionella genomosp. 1 TaxID=1093625 RepID=UPI0010545CC7|nr:acyltransferase family protein [Legionella genomosp. 1]